MAHNARIAEAITNVETEDRPNITVTARKFRVARETLLNRFRGKTGLIQEVSRMRNDAVEKNEAWIVDYNRLVIETEDLMVFQKVQGGPSD